MEMGFDQPFKKKIKFPAYKFFCWRCHPLQDNFMPPSYPNMDSGVKGLKAFFLPYFKSIQSKKMQNEGLTRQRMQPYTLHPVLGTAVLVLRAKPISPTAFIL
jgi:hypothetical protein